MDHTGDGRSSRRRSGSMTTRRKSKRKSTTGGSKVSLPRGIDPAHATAWEEAVARGLPTDWTVKFDPRRRRKWSSPPSADGKGRRRTFDSLPKALAYVESLRNSGNAAPPTARRVGGIGGMAVDDSDDEDEGENDDDEDDDDDDEGDNDHNRGVDDDDDEEEEEEEIVEIVEEVVEDDEDDEDDDEDDENDQEMQEEEDDDDNDDNHNTRGSRRRSSSGRRLLKRSSVSSLSSSTEHQARRKKQRSGSLSSTNEGAAAGGGRRRRSKTSDAAASSKRSAAKAASSRGRKGDSGSTVSSGSNKRGSASSLASSKTQQPSNGPKQSATAAEKPKPKPLISAQTVFGAPATTDGQDKDKKEDEDDEEEDDDDDDDDIVEPDPETDPETTFDVLDDESHVEGNWPDSLSGGPGSGTTLSATRDGNNHSGSSSSTSNNHNTTKSSNSLDASGVERSVWTVHWDPDSAEGQKVGYRIRIFDATKEEWKTGRILRYDFRSNKHKVAFDGTPPSMLLADAAAAAPKRRGRKKKPSNICWLKLSDEVVQVGGRFVWAHVKGFAWWPAQVLLCDPPSTSMREGYVFVEFFAADQVATVKDTPEFIRPFNDGKVDAFMLKNKKKRNAKAIDHAKQEVETTRAARREAVRFYAEKAFAFANKRAGGYLRKRIEVFRSDINYPYGDTVKATVREYSASQRKFLLSFDPPSRSSSQRYDPAWINFWAKEYNHKILSSGETANPTDKDLAAYMVGFLDSDDQVKSELSSLCANCCQELQGVRSLVVTCQKCRSTFHSSCLDPPLSPRAVERLSQDGWLCHRCTPCRGCCQLDLAFGCRPCPPPPTLSTYTGLDASLLLCSSCIPLYDNNQYCANCGHCWDDVRYQKAMRRSRWEEKMEAAAADHAQNASTGSNTAAATTTTTTTADASQEAPPQPRKRGRPRKVVPEPPKPKNNDEDDKEDAAGEKRRKMHAHDSPNAAEKSTASSPGEEITVFRPSSVIDPSWFLPEASQWGYNEGAMLICDGCNLWVHAGCALLSREEYEQTNKGRHSVYSKEFLCRVCCMDRCRAILKALQRQDSMMMFASPVTEAMAPDYRDVIQNPMDLQTMSRHAEAGDYRNYAWVRESFELMVLNALTFNRPNTALWNEAKRFHQASMETVLKDMAKAAPPSKHARGIDDAFASAQRALDMEVERTRQDQTAEKKDLVAGAQVMSVQLAPLAKPIDQPSCVSFVTTRIRPVEAFYSAWMECCFSCGSSGAVDTMLFCVDCGQAYHSFCANAPIHSMDQTAVSGWRCANCKICEIHGDLPDDELHLLYCEMCDRAFTRDALDPPLKTVPTGLWICGQCVDCAECQNTGDGRGKVSRKYWSRDPQKCYRCGGCSGLVGSYTKGKKCPVCAKFIRSADDNWIKCGTCERSVHLLCDERAADFPKKRARDSTGDSKDPGSYECLVCRKKKGEAQQARKKKEEVQHIQQQQPQKPAKEPGKGSGRRKSNSAPAPEEMSAWEFQQKLTEEVEWAKRNQWRSEYLSVVDYATRLIERRVGTNIRALLDSDDRCHGIPSWMVDRATRFIRFARKRRQSRVPIRDRRIRPLVNLAKMAASYLNVVSRSFKLDVLRGMTYPDKLKALLLPPCAASGTVSFSSDPVKLVETKTVVENKHFMQQWDAFDEGEKKREEEDRKRAVEEERKKQESERRRAQLEAEAEAKAKAAAQEAAAATPRVPMPTPLLGWSADEAGGENQHVWKDPRMCCLCRTCGDDDAGLASTTIAPLPEDDEPIVTGELGRAGRLLPMPNGQWVHAYCALWSSEVWEDQSAGVIKGLDKARYRGSKLKCFGCGRPGATIGCHKSNCPHNYHFQCATACGGVFTTQQQMFCRAHRSSVPPTDCVVPNFGEPMRILRTFAAQKDEVPETPADDHKSCFRLGSLLVHSLGTIEQKEEGYHTKHYIFPPGYMATRIFWSFVAPRKRTLYILRVERSPSHGAIFCILAADSPDTPIRGHGVEEVYRTLKKKVWAVHKSMFASSNELYSRLPLKRARKKPVYGLTGAQFFGFGLMHVRRALEASEGAEAVAVPLTKDSPTYAFCYILPSEDSIKSLQRKRAAAAAEKALENTSGSARTEGMRAVDRSGGSGRITRALVRSAEELTSGEADGPWSSGRGAGRNSLEGKLSFESNQAKYIEMKSKPWDSRLAAKRSHIHGWGLFAKVDLPKNCMIIEYMGETVRQCVADKREAGYEKSGIGSCYMFRLDANRIVDATLVGCMARFMNHSCDANAYAKIISVSVPSDHQFGMLGLALGGSSGGGGGGGPGSNYVEKKIVVFANRDIAAGEEITYDYKFPVEDGSLRCTCGAPNCVGRMN